MHIPYTMRGQLYPSHLSARCPIFRACELCKGCRRYDHTSLVCRVCESGHKQKMLCRHGERTLLVVKRVERLMGGEPIFKPDRKPGTIVLQNEPGEEVARIAEQFEVAESLS